ncbi:GNAT family N-acetyltransferase [Shewanella sp.]|uniref:GNAT family N-acetyltransferase n=1 Tax=Shewanella sp. TaxID=50422 RepID=UPI001EC50DA4|nr:GNAT family N-acetyltransferase [Shewanella sp.]NRB24598.1 GNAT family N-acetyltransferase [Shewanella sp.]
MKIRKSIQQDASVISPLITALAEKYILPTCTGEGGKLLLASMTIESIEQYFTDGYQYHVAEDAGGIMGVVGIKNNAHLYHLFVAEAHQGQGISTQLWEHAKEACLQKGNKGVFTVNSALNAKNVYLKLGFSPTGCIREKSGIKDIPMQMNIYLNDDK